MTTISFTLVTTPTAIHTVAELAEIIWHEHFTPIIGEAQVAYMLKNYQSHAAITAHLTEGFLYYVITEDTDPIGYFSIRVEGKELFLSKLYLTKAKRGHGIGRQAFSFIEEYARSHNCARIWLTVNKNNTGSIAAYQKWGFTITGPLVQDIGEGFIMDDHKMEKQLT